MGTLTSGNVANQVDSPDGDGAATIQVSANGEVESEPDQAILQVAVVATGEDATTARDRLAENVEQMRNALRDAGIEDDQVRTAYFDISQNFRTTTEDREPSGYQATQAFEVTLSNVSRAGEIIDIAVNNGANRVDGVQFTLADDTRQQLRAEALRLAVNNARTEADVLANASDLAITNVEIISTSQGNVVPYEARTVTAEAADASTNIESGPVTVTASVTVSYNATATSA